ncbi:MAG: hypothetical protein ISS36_02455 [Candidatus Aenigmarchaeota archaeon]|nr:hypothetical protein [Candidatus Aenigmarchaeota archaeon]
MRKTKNWNRIIVAVMILVALSISVLYVTIAPQGWFMGAGFGIQTYPYHSVFCPDIHNDQSIDLYFPDHVSKDISTVNIEIRNGGGTVESYSCPKEQDSQGNEIYYCKPPSGKTVFSVPRSTSIELHECVLIVDFVDAAGQEYPMDLFKFFATPCESGANPDEEGFCPCSQDLRIPAPRTKPNMQINPFGPGYESITKLLDSDRCKTNIPDTSLSWSWWESKLCGEKEIFSEADALECENTKFDDGDDVEDCEVYPSLGGFSDCVGSNSVDISNIEIEQGINKINPNDKGIYDIEKEDTSISFFLNVMTNFNNPQSVPEYKLKIENLLRYNDRDVDDDFEVKLKSPIIDGTSGSCTFATTNQIPFDMWMHIYHCQFDIRAPTDIAPGTEIDITDNSNTETKSFLELGNDIALPIEIEVEAYKSTTAIYDFKSIGYISTLKFRVYNIAPDIQASTHDTAIGSDELAEVLDDAKTNGEYDGKNFAISFTIEGGEDVQMPSVLKNDFSTLSSGNPLAVNTIDNNVVSGVNTQIENDLKTITRVDIFHG